MNSKLWLAIAVVVIIATIGAFLAFQQQPPAQTTTPQTATQPIQTTKPKGTIYVIYDIGGRGICRLTTWRI
jgi:basic membrane protein A